MDIADSVQSITGPPAEGLGSGGECRGGSEEERVAETRVEDRREKEVAKQRSEKKSIQRRARGGTNSSASFSNL